MTGVRLDPYQNIVNVHWAGYPAFLISFDGIMALQDFPTYDPATDGQADVTVTATSFDTSAYIDSSLFRPTDDPDGVNWGEGWVFQLGQMTRDIPAVLEITFTMQFRFSGGTAMNPSATFGISNGPSGTTLHGQVLMSGLSGDTDTTFTLVVMWHTIEQTLELISVDPADVTVIVNGGQIYP